MTKTCTKCGNEKGFDEFHLWARSKDGRKSHCKLCSKKYGETYMERGTGARPVFRNQRKIMLDQQDYKCAICNSPTPKSKRGWALDHDHVTGELRQVLCSPCNVALGMVGDKEDILLNMVAYLGFHKSQLGKLKAVTV